MNILEELEKMGLVGHPKTAQVEPEPVESDQFEEVSDEDLVEGEDVELEELTESVQPPAPKPTQPAVAVLRTLKTRLTAARTALAELDEAMDDVAVFLANQETE